MLDQVQILVGLSLGHSVKTSLKGTNYAGTTEITSKTSGHQESSAQWGRAKPRNFWNQTVPASESDWNWHMDILVCLLEPPGWMKWGDIGGTAAMQRWAKCIHIPLYPLRYKMLVRTALFASQEIETADNSVADSQGEGLEHGWEVRLMPIGPGATNGSWWEQTWLWAWLYFPSVEANVSEYYKRNWTEDIPPSVDHWIPSHFFRPRNTLLQPIMSNKGQRNTLLRISTW